MCLAARLVAVETLIVGAVADSNTGLPIENANVYYKGTDIGCATDAEGIFLLRTDNNKTAWLVVSAVGYKQQKFKIEPGQQGGLQVALEELNTMLEDVFAVPDENPALSLMARVRQNRVINDICNDNSIITKAEEHGLLFVSDLNENHLKRKLWQSMQSGMLQAEDSTWLVPIYSVHRQYSKQGVQRKPLADDEIKASGPDAADYSLMLSGIDADVNFYHSSVSIMSKNFLSPISGVGNNHYRFFLVDSIATPAKHYIVHFRAKNQYALCFNGEMEIDSLTAAVCRIEASVPREAGVNYLTSYTVSQTFDSLHRPLSENLSATFNLAIKADSSHIFPSVLFTRQRKTTDIDIVDIPDSGLKYTTEQISAAMDSVNNTPVFRVARFIAHIFNTGNIPTGTVVDIGNVADIIGYNKYEGFHIGLPFTTNEKLFKNVELSAMVSYGFRDHAYKGKGQVLAKLPVERRHVIGASYSDQYANMDLSPLYLHLRENRSINPDQDYAYMIFSALRSNSKEFYSATRLREFRLWTENEWTDNIDTEFNIRIGRMGYGSPFDGYYNIPSYKFKTLQGMLRVGFEERKVDIFLKRVHVKSKYPTLYMMLEGGSYRTQTMERDRLYGRVSLMVTQTIPLGICGSLNYAAMTGCVIGKVPYPMLEYFVGNPTYTYDPYRFTLMGQMQYAADFYIMGHIHWNMQGLMFNVIPYIQRLHLRELLEFKIGWGMLNDKHNSVIELPAYIQPLKIPYLEAGIGIGNILRVADIYAVFRLTNNTSNDISWWGIRARFSFGL